MLKQGWCTCVLTLALIAGVGTAEGAVLYLGLPDGTSIALSQSASRFTRAPEADLPSVGSSAFPAFADLDGDGDRDTLVGDASGRVQAFVNTGSDARPVWLRQASWDVGISLGKRPAPALADLDGDGDIDLMVGTKSGMVRAFENIGSSAGPAWRQREAWNVDTADDDARPALGRVNGDGRVDLAVGAKSGVVRVYLGTGSTAAPFAPASEWDLTIAGSDRVAVSLGDADGDGREDLFVGDGLAKTTVMKNTGAGWTATTITVPDPGSGPAGPAFVREMKLGPSTGSPVPPAATPTPRPTQTATSTTQTGGTTPAPTANAPAGAPVARLSADRTSGSAPLGVRFDATASSDPQGDPLSFTWDFGDGSASGGSVPADPAAAIREAKDGYTAAKATRDAGHYEDAVAQYLVNVDLLIPLTTVTIDGPVKAQGTSRIDRVARWYLQKTAHDLGGIYLWHSLGLTNCPRYSTSLQYSRESAAQAVAGGFPGLPDSNGTAGNIATATDKLVDKGCTVPAPQPMFPVAGASGDPIASHTYTTNGTYQARVTVSDGARQATASLTITVGAGGGGNPQPTTTATGVPASPTPRPTNAPPPSGGDQEPYQGFGAQTRGGEGGRVIRVTQPTDAAVRAAFKDGAGGNAQIVFEVTGPIEIQSPLPQLTGAFITVEGNGVELVGIYGNPTAAMVDVRGHDVIVRNMRLRNGGDNLRAQKSGAYNIVFSHISSTGAADDGISIGYGAHDVTVQYCFLAGNTRSLFLKYGTTNRVSIHHTWIMKQWIRGPLVSTNVMADIRNIVVEDWSLWGTRFEAKASGNIVNSTFRLGTYAKSIGGKAAALNLIQDGEVFSAGNVYEGVATEQRQAVAAAPLDAPAVTTQPAGEAADLVEARAGCVPRDSVDQAYIDTRSGWRVGESTPLRIGH